MRVAIRAVAIALAVLLAGLTTVAITARFRDGPFGPFPGGALQRGPLIRGELPGADTIARVTEVELQLHTPPRSRVTWIVEHEGGLYIPCAFLSVPLLKRWPYEALADGRATLRVLGRRYEGRLVRVKDPALFRATTRKVAQKYGVTGEADPEEVWVFRFESALSPEGGTAFPASNEPDADETPEPTPTAQPSEDAEDADRG